MDDLRTDLKLFNSIFNPFFDANIFDPANERALPGSSKRTNFVRENLGNHTATGRQAQGDTNVISCERFFTLSLLREPLFLRPDGISMFKKNDE